ncbi:hypothetical protein CSB45_03945 [candidate division KSB3 bacterium]|uniref:Uncharacterized protein n=1 Tax=candidate division KSB3 bacterium TaxID=2044937 RepID=A0A2G6E7Z7_9BACT|nr:MAG: hypothetical protein CSB45_03945 [candidate division KSB3 bacterium]PIE30533.1 MAG: hypothetical protein CSA57_02530 [candidate division KSB3 bacterium]
MSIVLKIRAFEHAVCGSQTGKMRQFCHQTCGSIQQSLSACSQIFIDTTVNNIIQIYMGILRIQIQGENL